VILARLERKGGRDSEYLGTAQREQTIEFREAYVVADREPDGRCTSLRRHDLRACRYGQALQVFPIRGLHVEEVYLAVDR
jgi:hypothetical protein